MAISPSDKQQVVELMLAGSSWQEATQQVGVQVSMSTAYRWVREWRQEGAAGLSDGRHGHAHKVTPEIRAWLQETCGQAPHTPSSKIKEMIKAKFEVEISRGTSIGCGRNWGSVGPKKAGPERNPLARECRQSAVVSGGARNGAKPAVRGGAAGRSARVPVSPKPERQSPPITADVAVSGSSGAGTPVGVTELQR